MNQSEHQIVACLVDLPPLASLLFHKLRVDARHDFVKLLATRQTGTRESVFLDLGKTSDVAHKLNVLDWFTLRSMNLLKILDE